MRILIIGNSAREHALAWKFNLDGENVFSLPGNGGTCKRSENITSFPGLNSEDRLTFLKVARDWAIGLVVPGPADLIVRGIAEVLEGSGIACSAPSRAAAAIEGSRVLAKDFIKRHNIPTAEHRYFINYEEAKAYLSTVTHRVVIKASGVQVARGVVLPESQEEAQHELHEIMVNMKFGPGGELVVIEEFLTGDGISIHSFCDGFNFIFLPPCQVHKRMLMAPRARTRAAWECTLRPTLRLMG
jgi:phosphoribosylamine--glycine ligase / phosphoribosylformylglycinamidine cyclo-ligase